MIDDLNDFFYNYVKYQTLLYCKNFIANGQPEEIEFLLNVSRKDLKGHKKGLDKTNPKTHNVRKIYEACYYSDSAKIDALEFCLSLCGNEDYNKLFNRVKRECEKKYKESFSKLPKKVLLCNVIKLGEILDEYSDELGVETALKEGFVDFGTNKTNLKFENGQVSIIDDTKLHGFTSKHKPAFLSLISFKKFKMPWPIAMDAFLDISQIYLTKEAFDAMPEDSRIKELTRDIFVEPNLENFNFDSKLKEVKMDNGKIDKGKTILGGLEKLFFYSCIAQNIEREKRLSDKITTKQIENSSTENQ